MNRDIMPHSRGKKVGDIGMDIGLLALIGVGAYLLIKNFSSLFSSTASQAIQANNADVTKNTQAANTATQQQIAATGQTPTLTPANINALANTIITAMTSSGDYPFDASDQNAQTISSSVTQVNNTADWIALVGQFGTKQLLNGQTVDLLTGLSIVVPPSMKSALDSYFLAQNIGSPNFIMIP
jgi:hypothetical protein